MKRFLVILFIFPLFLQAQTEPVEQDSIVDKYLIIEGDSIPRKAIDLDEVLVLPSLKFVTKEERYRYLILRRKTRKVYPYAKMAAERLIELNEELKQFEKRRKKKKHAKKVHAVRHPWLTGHAESNFENAFKLLYSRANRKCLVDTN
jgi:sulfur transfer protein SufE